MEITFQETSADLRLLERLRSPGLPVAWLLSAVLLGTIAGIVVLAAMGFWRASLFPVVFLILFVWIRLAQKSPRATGGDERKLRFTDTHFEQTWRGEVHQTAWATNLRFESTAKYWILRRERLTLAILPRRAVSSEQASALEDRLGQLLGARAPGGDAQPVPMWSDAQQRVWRFSIKHTLAEEDLRGDTFQRYLPTGHDLGQQTQQPVQPPSHRGAVGCLLTIVILGFIVLLGGSRRHGLLNEFGAGLVAVTLGIVLPVVVFLAAQRVAVRKFFAGSPSFFNHEQMVALDESGVWQGSTRGFSFIPWTNLQAVMVGNKRLVGLQHTSGLVYVTLKDAFASEQEMRSFLDFAAERIAIADAPIVDATLVEPRPDSGNPYQSPSTT